MSEKLQKLLGGIVALILGVILHQVIILRFFHPNPPILGIIIIIAIAQALDPTQA